MISFTATYSPEDNKIRLYASSRLDAETYALAVLELAAAAARECAQAVLEAVLARSDADAACLSPLVSEGAPPS